MQRKTIQLLRENEFLSLPLSLAAWDRVFLRGDLGAGKTTFARHIITQLMGGNVSVKSPTYVYYNKYGKNIYHFDLYRITSYDDFVNIGGEEILDDIDNICIIEWPELLAHHYLPTVDIELLKTKDNLVREVTITNYLK